MAQQSVTTGGPWLYSKPVDLLVGCGGWSLPLLILALTLQQTHAAATAFAFYVLALFVNNPHYMATVRRAYAADARRYHRVFTVYVTVLLVAAGVLTQVVPGIAPWVITVYLTWNPWHYSGQNFGLAQMFARRAGLPPDPLTRRLLYASYVASVGIWVVALHVAREVGDPNFRSLSLPSSLATPVEWMLALVFITCASVAFVRMYRAAPAGTLLPTVMLTTTQGLWFVAPALYAAWGGPVAGISYFSAGVLAFMHCAQYLWVTTYAAAREPRREGERFRAARHYGVLVVGGIALFVPLPWLISRVGGRDFVDVFLVCSALVNLHHFLLDGVIWKLRDSRVAGLLLGASRANRTVHPSSEAGNENVQTRPWPARAVLRGAVVAGLLALAALDVWQFGATLETADIRMLQSAARVNPFDPRPAFRLAQSTAASGDLAGARLQLERLVAAAPANYGAHYLLGEVLNALGEHDAAERHYRVMAGRFPTDLIIATNRANLALDAGRAGEAALHLSDALAVAPSRHELHFLRAEALARSGDVSGAQAEYATFLRLAGRRSPYFATASRRIQALRAGATEERP